MNDDEKREQAELVKMYQEGNGKAGEALYQKYQPLLRKLSYDPFRKRIDEDMYQTLSLAFIEKLRAYDSEKAVPLAVYLKQHLTWAKLDYQRKEVPYQKRDGFDLAKTEEEGKEDEINLPESDVAPMREKALCCLAKSQRPLFLLMAEGKQRKEIQDILHLSPQNLYNQQRRIRERLAKNSSFMKAVVEWGIAG